MYIYYRPDDGQVMALYSDEPNSVAFTALGYLVARVPLGVKISRDMAVSVEDGVVVDVSASPNALQPALPAEAVRARAVSALLDELITARAKDADAPQAIKDAAR